MKALLRPLLDKFPYVGSLRRRVAQQMEAFATQQVVIEQHRQQLEQMGVWPPGHYYSPVPDKIEALTLLKRTAAASPEEVAGVELNAPVQRDLLAEYARFYGELPFPEKQTSGNRYYYENDWYSYGDAIFLYSFLRKHMPRRIVEVGSGFSSAVILDTVDRFFPERPEISFVEPYPDRLNSLLTSEDQKSVRIFESKIQETPTEIFESLQAGDLLFIDSSHVVKCGSDLQYLMFEILPILPAGVYVHFHDVFAGFEYPAEWIQMGHYWNECYFLRAFLSYNQEWSVYFFNNFAAKIFTDHLRQAMPLCLKNPGGGLYIRRHSKAQSNRLPLRAAS